MLEKIAVVEIPPCDRDFTTTCGVVIEFDENSKRLFVNSKERKWKYSRPPEVGDKIYLGCCHSSGETCDHCQGRELYGEIKEIKTLENAKTKI